MECHPNSSRFAYRVDLCLPGNASNVDSHNSSRFVFRAFLTNKTRMSIARAKRFNQVQKLVSTRCNSPFQPGAKSPLQLGAIVCFKVQWDVKIKKYLVLKRLGVLKNGCYVAAAKGVYGWIESEC